MLPHHYHLASQCVNMRPSPCNPEVLIPAATPATMALHPWKHLGHFLDADNKVTEIFYHDDSLLARTYQYGTTPPDPYTVTDSLPGTPTTCLLTSTGFTILTTSDPLDLLWDDNSTILRALPLCGVNDFPAITSATVNETSLPFNTGTLKLTREYNSLPENLDPADSRSLTDMITSVIESTADRATLDHVFTAPVLFRYRLLGDGGRVLFTSVPRLHVPSGRHAPSSPLRVAPDGKTIPQALSSIEGFGIEVNLPPVTSALVRNSVERVELQLSRQLHISIADFLSLSQVRRENSSCALDIYIPRYATHATLESEVLKILKAPDENFTTSATLFSPFSSSSSQRVILSPLPVRINDEKTVRTSSTPLPFLRYLNYHDHGATVGINDAHRRLLADIHLRRYRGASLPYFINTGETLDNIETVMTVTFENGDKIVSSRYTRSERDIFLSPLLVYPDPAARKIEIQLCDSDGTNRYASFPLSPVDDVIACYINPGLQPIPLTHSASTPEFIIPASTGIKASFPGHLLTVENGNSVSVTSIGSGKIHSIKPVCNPSASAWEASRSRFHLLASDGIYALSLNGGTLLAPRQLDSRPVLRPDATAILSTTNGNIHYAIAGGDLVTIESNRVKTLQKRVTETILAPLPRYGEILLIPLPHDDATTIVQATVLHSYPSRGWSKRTLPAPLCQYSNGTVSYLTARDSLIDLNDEIAVPVQCHYHRELKTGIRHPHGIPARMSSIYIDIDSPSARGDITLTASHGTQEGQPLSRLTIDGAINTPLCHHLLVPRRRRLWLTLNLSLHPASHYHPLNP